VKGSEKQDFGSDFASAREARLDGLHGPVGKMGCSKNLLTMCEKFYIISFLCCTSSDAKSGWFGSGGSASRLGRFGDVL
jgi:hypothetical protein